MSSVQPTVLHEQLLIESRYLPATRNTNPEFFDKCQEYLIPYYDNPEGDDRISILVIGYQDFANVMSAIADAVNRYNPDYQMRVFCTNPHPFYYYPPHHFDYDAFVSKNGLRPYLDKVKIIIWAEECVPQYYYSYYSLDSLFRNTMILNTNLYSNSQITKIVFHAGCPKRNHTLFYQANDILNFDGGLYSPDLLRLAPPNWIAYPLLGKPLIIQNFPVRSEWNEDELLITHSPTNFALKGTEIIRQAIELTKTMTNHSFRYNEIGGPHHTGMSIRNSELANLRVKYHVYIDQISSIGGIGMSSFESMLTGLVTICSVQNIDSQLFGERCPLIRCNYDQPSVDLIIHQLAGILTGLVKMYAETRHQFVTIAEESRAWAANCTDPEKFSQRFGAQLKLITEKIQN